MRPALLCALGLLVAHPAQARDTIVVHVKGGSGVVLERQPAHDSSGPWTPMCTSPCSVVAERDEIYRLGGDGVRRSESIQLPKDGDETTLYVTKQTNGEHAGAWFMSILGGALLVGGAGTIIGALVAFPTTTSATCLSSCSNASAGSQTLLTAGVIGLVLGGVVMVFGIISTKQTAKTTFVQMPQVNIDVPPGLERPTGPVATMLPLVQVTF